MAEISSARPGRVSRTTVVDTAWAMFGLGGPTVLQLLYVIAAARGLGPDQFGLLMLCVAVATVASFVAGLGGDGVALKAVARSPEEVAGWFGQALALIGLTALPVAGASVGLTMWLARVDIPVWLPVSIAVSEILFGRVAMTCQKLFIAFSQQARAALAGMFVPLARIVSALAVVAFSWQEPLEAFATAYFVSTFVAMICCYLYTVWRLGRPRFNLGKVRLGEGMSFAISWINTSLQVEADKMILAYFATPAAVGVYALGSRLMDGAFSPPRALRISLQARMMREGAKGHRAVYRFMLRIVPVTVAYGFVCWGMVALLAPLVIHIFGEEYGELVRILPLLGALPLLRSIADIGAELFVASDKVAVSTAIQLVTTALRVGIGVVLIGSFGINGAVGAALIATILAGLIFWSAATIIDRRQVQIQSPQES